MARSPQLARVVRAWRLAQQCHARNLRARDVLDLEHSVHARRWSRRDVLKAGVAAGAAAMAPLAAPAALRAAAPRVAIVGAGLAGLACADRLQSKGVQAVVYEAAPRL